MKIALITLGCPKNVVDSERIKGALESTHVNIVTAVEAEKYVDVILINTCGFIQSAKTESIETIFEALQLKEQGRCGRVFVVGCLVNRYFNELKQEIPEVDGFYVNRNITQTIRALAKDLQIKYTSVPVRTLLTPKHYAYLKIAEGCNNCCSYCAIPAIRGPLKSRAEPEIVNEARLLVENGVRELILIAQDITNYGKDGSDSKRIIRLIRQLVQIRLLKWLRLMYAHPAHFPDELIELMATEAKICKYIDLPLQHISDRILKRMNRQVTRAQIEKLIQKLRDQIPGIAIRTSFIVGFPGETEAEFEALLDFLTAVKFERVGAFTYSPEEETPAFELKDRIEPALQQERLDEIMFRQAEISFARNLALVGSQMEVVIDEFDSEMNQFLSRSQWDAPEIDNIIWINPSANLKIGKFYQVQIQKAYEFDLFGEPISSVSHLRRGDKTS